jgi:hypothetical protein
MKVFTIDRDNNIAVYESAEEVPTGAEVNRFSSEKELRVSAGLESTNGRGVIRTVRSGSEHDGPDIGRSTASRPPCGRIRPDVHRASTVLDGEPAGSDSSVG